VQEQEQQKKRAEEYRINTERQRILDEQRRAEQARIDADVIANREKGVGIHKAGKRNQSKRKQSKRNQNKRKQSKRKQSKRIS